MSSMRSKHEWQQNEYGEVVNQDNEFITGQQLAKEHHNFVSSPGKTYKEKYFQEAIEYVLIQNQIDYISEYTVGKGDNQRRRADIYIPQTDTVIELKLEANLRGVGQAAYYAQHHRESILLCENHTEEVAKTIRSLPAVHYGTALPGPDENPPMLSITSDSRCEFFHQAKHGTLGNSDWFLKKPRLDSATGRTDRQLSEFERGAQI